MKLTSSCFFRRRDRPEVMGEVARVVAWVNANGLAAIETEADLVGGCAYDAHGQAISRPHGTRPCRRRRHARRGGRPEMGWRRLRSAPRGRAAPLAQGPRALRQSPPRHLLSRSCRRFLAEARPRRRPRHHIVRELTGGSYFGQPKEIVELPAGQKRPSTRRFTTPTRSSASPRSLRSRPRAPQAGAFGRQAQLYEDRRAVNEVVTRLHKERYGDVTLHHILADNCAMQLCGRRAVRRHRHDNLFGDMLSDERRC